MIQTGIQAPHFRLPRLDGGGEVSISDVIASGPAALAFFKVTCPVCQLTFPYLERIHTAGKLPVFAVSQNSAAHTREFNEAFRITFPTLLDPEHRFPASNAFGITHVPTVFLIEPDGLVSRVIEGWNRNEIQSLGALGGIDPIRPGEYVPEWKAG